MPWELTREGSPLAGETVKERQVLKEATLARGSRSYGGHRQLAGIFLTLRGLNHVTPKPQWDTDCVPSPLLSVESEESDLRCGR